MLARLEQLGKNVIGGKGALRKTRELTGRAAQVEIPAEMKVPLRESCSSNWLRGGRKRYGVLVIGGVAAAINALKQGVKLGAKLGLVDSGGERVAEMPRRGT